MSSISIIGCGPTAPQWDGTGLSIGVNDCWRFGKPTDHLVCVNTKKQFTDERLSWILNSQPTGFYTHYEEYREHFPKEVFVKLQENEFQKWRGRLQEGILQFSKTSPFVAISLAHKMGATEINIYGVDFVDHKVYNPTNEVELKAEIRNYKDLFDQLKAKGIKITTTKESYLNHIL